MLFSFVTQKMLPITATPSPQQSLIIWRTINTPQTLDNGDQLEGKSLGLLNLLRLGHCLSQLYNRPA